jgi:folylpolyglutamate synthase/dihydropteroate synthase
MLERLARAGRTLVATASSSDRALPPEELAARARPYFERVEAVERPLDALARARELARRSRPVLVTGSLYLLQDIAAAAETVR